MKRRECITVLGSAAAAWPMVARGQDRIRKIGVLMNFAAADRVAKTRLSNFREALASLGWNEGRSVEIETR
jgi:putative tryptophan/tyrosine transport system substrate-binding protein